MDFFIDFLETLKTSIGGGTRFKGLALFFVGIILYLLEVIDLSKSNQKLAIEPLSSRLNLRY